MSAVALLRFVILCFVSIAAAGCASSHRSQPYIERQNASVVVAIGYFSSGERQASPHCALESAGTELEGVIDCFGSNIRINRARFVVRDVLLGELPLHAIDVTYHYYESDRPIDIGAGRLHLVVVQTDRRSYRLDGYARVFPISPRGYAIPIDLRDRPVRCWNRNQKIAGTKVQFRSPRPRASVASLDLDESDVEDLIEDQDPAVEVRGGHVYWQEGIPVDDVVAAYKALTKDELLDSCY